MKINYPVKYAAMPIIEKINYYPGLYDLGREYDVVCFIVSKCYLIKENKKYRENGYTENEYEVVFPYQQNNINSLNWIREMPSYNVVHGYCANSSKIDEIFDSYEEALKYVTNKNEELCNKSILYLPFREDYMQKEKEAKDDFHSKLSKYKLLEQQILSNTEDMKIGENKELSKAIRIDNNNVKICNANIYEILNIYDEDYFIVYSVSQEQYDSLINLINKQKFNDKSQIVFEGQLVHNQDGELLNELNSEYSDLSFYTTESINDLLCNKKDYVEIDLNKDENPILSKRKKI